MAAINLIVDKIVHQGIGETTDIKKIYYNLEQMGEYGKKIQQAINIKLLLVERDAEAIGSIGRFICITNFQKDESTAFMNLFDCKLVDENGWEKLSKIQYPEHAIEFMKIYHEAFLASLSDESDTFELCTVFPP